MKAGSYVRLDDEAAYAITHTLFYLTDFGGRGAALSHRQRERAVDLVEVLLLHYWRTGRWDLVGELLSQSPTASMHAIRGFTRGRPARTRRHGARRGLCRLGALRANP